MPFKCLLRQNILILLIAINHTIYHVDAGGAILEAGPYKMEVKRFEKCPKEGSKEMVMDLHLRKADRKTVFIYGNITFKYPLNRDIQFKLTSSVWGNGGWRENHFTLNGGKDSCAKIYELMGEFWKKLWVLVNHTWTEPCSIPAGRYVLNNLNGKELRLPKIPIMIYGLYRNDMMICSADDKLLGCVRSVFAITKKD